MRCDSLVSVGRPTWVAFDDLNARVRMWSRHGGGREDSAGRWRPASTTPGGWQRVRGRIPCQPQGPQNNRVRTRRTSSMHRSKAAIAAALLTVLALLPIAVAPVAAGDQQAKANAEHERIVKFWTAERIKSAKPRDFVIPVRGKAQPAAKPVKPPRGGGNVSGASWTGGGPVVPRTGKLYFELGGGYWVCSA